MQSEKASMSAPVHAVVHTPGPWEAYHVQSAGWSVRMAKPREGYDQPDPICSMAWWQFDKPGIIDNDISGANAKLIAASPDLLAALQKFVNWHYMDHETITGVEVQKAYDQAIDAAKSALRKVV